MQTNRLGANATQPDLLREHNRVVTDIEQIEQNRLQGRIRTLTRAVPATETDVVAGDAEGDVLTDATHRYELLSYGGTMLWDKRLRAF